MYDAPATSDEHIPPKCLFPERKDLPSGMDLRRNLLKVPSCDTHNSRKSNDDEYFLYILSTSFQINEIGRNHYRTKVRRAIKRNSSVLGKIASTAKSTNYIDPASGHMVNSVAHYIEPTRFNTIVDRLGRAIFLHHFKEKWESHILRYQAEFLFATANQLDKANLHLLEISKQADGWFSSAGYYGDNPEVFKYQAIESKTLKLMRLHFYETCRLLLIFKRQQGHALDRQEAALAAQ